MYIALNIICAILILAIGYDQGWKAAWRNAEEEEE